MAELQNTSPFDTEAEGINFSLEIFPPKVGAKTTTDHWNAIDSFCKLRPSCISITCGAFGSNSQLPKDIALKIRDMGANPAVHFTCLNKTRTEVESIARDYKANGINNIVALRGDYPIDGSPQELESAKSAKGKLHHAYQLVEVLTSIGGFDISVASYPEKHPEAKSMQEDIDHLKQKLDAGADRSITQFFFDPDVFLEFREKATAAGISKPIIPGILPILNINKAITFADKCGVNLPDFLLRMYKDVPLHSLDHKLLAMNILSHQITRLLSEGVRFFHFYTLNDIMLSTHICKWLKEAF